MGVYLPAPGTMREVVSFQREYQVSDGAGGSSSNWANTITDIQARVTPVRGTEQIIAAGLQATFWYQIWVRSTSETRTIQESDRCINPNTGMYFDIVSIQNPDEKNRFLLMLCERGVAQ